MSWSTLILAIYLSATPARGTVLAETDPVHLGISLAVTHGKELDALRREQQDPGSPNYHRWLSPEEYGGRFGQPASTYAAAVSWLSGAGFQVTEHRRGQRRPGGGQRSECPFENSRAGCVSLAFGYRATLFQQRDYRPLTAGRCHDIADRRAHQASDARERR